jgi:hypothetical protein
MHNLCLMTEIWEQFNPTERRGPHSISRKTNQVHNKDSMECWCSNSQHKHCIALRKTHDRTWNKSEPVTCFTRTCTKLTQITQSNTAVSSKLYLYAEHTNTISIFLSHTAFFRISKEKCYALKRCTLPSPSSDEITTAKTQSKYLKLLEQSFTREALPNWDLLTTWVSCFLVLSCYHLSTYNGTGRGNSSATTKKYCSSSTLQKSWWSSSSHCVNTVVKIHHHFTRQTAHWWRIPTPFPTVFYVIQNIARNRLTTVLVSICNVCILVYWVFYGTTAISGHSPNTRTYRIQL